MCSSAYIPLIIPGAGRIIESAIRVTADLPIPQIKDEMRIDLALLAPISDQVSGNKAINMAIILRLLRANNSGKARAVLS